jgi:hypothetical protein
MYFLDEDTRGKWIVHLSPKETKDFLGVIFYVPITGGKQRYYSGKANLGRHCY